MSFKSSSRMADKNDYSSDTLERKNRRENFNRLKSIFEIKRPPKSRNPIIKKSKSTSALSSSASQSSDDERETVKDEVFVRKSSSCPSTRNLSRYKKSSVGSSLKEKSFKKDSSTVNIPGHTETFSTRIRQFEQQKNEENDSCVINFIFDKPCRPKSSKLKEISGETFDNNADNIPEPENDDTSVSKDPHDKKEYIKNTYTCDSSLGGLKSPKELISRKQAEDNEGNIKTFGEADYELETENYRRNLMNEMDRELAKMKLDGFIDEDGNLNTDNLYKDKEVNNKHQSNEEDEYDGLDAIEKKSSKYSRYKQFFEGMFHELDVNMQMIEQEIQESGEHDNIYEIIEKPCINKSREVHQSNCSVSPQDITEVDQCETKGIYLESQNGLKNIKTNDNDDANDMENNSLKEEQYTTPSAHIISFEDDFNESLGDDLENGSYFVEAYNDEGRELVIVEISLERRTVNLNKPFPLKTIQKSIKNADMVFHERDDKSLNLIENPKEFVHENSEMISNEFFNDPDSNRSTVYSTTSRESDVFDDDDEGISMGNVDIRTCTDDSAYNNVRRETFCDHKGVVRIERVGYPETVHNASLEDLQASVSRNNSFTQKGKLSYIIDEIKYTEKKYVADLNKVVKKYLPYIERHTPHHLLGRQYYMFGNIQILCRNQKKFLEALENCGEEVEDVIRTFIKFEELFKLYPTYFKNKPRADVAIKEFNSVIRQAQERFKDRLDLSAYLLTPLQRLGKYKLFLENIEKQLVKLELPSENATTALEIIKREMSKGNDFVAIESIQNSPILTPDYGSFKMREIFTVIKPRRFECMVFLFENVVVFTTLGTQRNMEIYTYYDSIKMNDLRIATFEGSTIHLTNFTKGKKLSQNDRFTYVLDAKTEKLKDSWRKAIEDILWQQLYKVKENTLKLYKPKPSKRGKISRSRIKSAGGSVFYCE